ncbi:MAG: hypothetical protein Ta2E_02260 [Mycoplasmoidaceae bacterium]|nr:MAG: hypothetical protein Ta2E_02260 [Mycoplasmoidaceae bacterium]
MKIKLSKLFFILLGTSLVATSIPMIVTSCSEKSTEQLQDIIPDVNKSYFSSIEDEIDADISGYIICTKADADYNKVEKISYFFKSTSVAKYIYGRSFNSNYLLSNSSNLNSILNVQIRMSLEDQAITEASQIVYSDTSLPDEVREEAQIIYYSLIAKYNRTYVEGKVVTKPFEMFKLMASSDMLSERVYKALCDSVQSIPADYNKLTANLDELYKSNLAPNRYNNWVNYNNLIMATYVTYNPWKETQLSDEVYMTMFNQLSGKVSNTGTNHSKSKLEFYAYVNPEYWTDAVDIFEAPTFITQFSDVFPNLKFSKVIDASQYKLTLYVRRNMN